LLLLHFHIGVPMFCISRIAYASDLTEQVYQRRLHAICDDSIARSDRVT
jgi:hypothetical protein